MYSFLFIRCRFPFDWKTPTGYLIAFLFQTICGWIIVNTGSNNISVSVATCLMFVACGKDASEEIFRIKDNIDDIGIKKNIITFIRLHSDSKQLRIISFFF